MLGGLEQIEEAPNPTEWPMWVQVIVVGVIGYGGIMIAVLMHFFGPVINFFMTLLGRPLFYDIRID